MLRFFKAIACLCLITLSYSSAFADWDRANWRDAIRTFTFSGGSDEIASIIGGGKKYGIHKRAANADETEFLAKRIIEVAHQRYESQHTPGRDQHLAKFITPFKEMDLTALEADDAKGLREHLSCVVGIYHITVAADQVVDEIYQHLAFGAHDNFGDLSKEGFVKRVYGKIVLLRRRGFGDLLTKPFFQDETFLEGYLDVTNGALNRILTWYEQVLQCRYNREPHWQEVAKRNFSTARRYAKTINGHPVIMNGQNEVIAVIKPNKLEVPGPVELPGPLVQKIRGVKREALNFELSKKLGLEGAIAENFIMITPAAPGATPDEKARTLPQRKFLVEKFYPYASKKVLRKMLITGGHEGLAWLLQKDTLAKFATRVGGAPLLGNRLSIAHLLKFRASPLTSDEEGERAIASSPIFSIGRFDIGKELFKMLVAAYLFDYTQGHLGNIAVSLDGPFRLSPPLVRWVNTQYSHGAAKLPAPLATANLFAEPKLIWRSERLPAVLGLTSINSGMTSLCWQLLGGVKFTPEVKALFERHNVKATAFRLKAEKLTYIYSAKVGPRKKGLTLDEEAAQVIAALPPGTEETVKIFIRQVYRVLRWDVNRLKIARILYTLNRGLGAYAEDSDLLRLMASVD